MSAESGVPEDRTEDVRDAAVTETPSRRTPDESTAALPHANAAVSSPSGDPDLPRLRPGERLAGRFEVVRFLARGGMGAVYEAEDGLLRTRVALKLIRGRIATDAIVMERFRREVLLARRVSHPSVCRVYELYDATTAAGEPVHFLTMELLLGETLSQRIARGRLTPEEALPLVRQLCDGLAAAHAEGVIHRDFKPSNVLLVPRRAAGTGDSGSGVRAVITDFGIARALGGAEAPREADGPLTGTAMILGTPEYMAPEQVTGSEVTAATDIYALGVVLYEMVTGKLPFTGSTPLATAARRLDEPPPRPDTAVPGLDGRWVAAIVRCLARQPEKRFRSAGEVVRAATTGEFQVHLLGQFRMDVDGRPIPGLTTGRLQSLLAYVLLHAGTPQSRAHLSFTFWPDVSESNARNNLRQLLHQLRQALPDPDRHLRADSSTVEWVRDSSFTLDVDLFEGALAEAESAQRAGDMARRRSTLERAADLCQGPLLPSCYEDWISPSRDRLARKCKEATTALVRMLEEEREYSSAIVRARHALEHDPLDEAAYRSVIRLLALAGDRAAALQTFRHCAEVLRRELKAEPGAETVRLYERIRSSELSSAPARPDDRGATESSLVGRQSEWAKLRGAWDEAVDGRIRFAVVSGEAGIGKSRLAEELLTWAERQGVTTARTRSYAAEGRLSFAPVSEWLRSPAFAPQLARIDEVWRFEVARILPELRAAGTGAPSPGPMNELGDRSRFFEGLARALLAAPQPLLLVFDDLQWSDRETLEWLHFLSRFEPDARFLVLGTVRAEEVDAAHPLVGFLRDRRAASQLTEIALEPLDAAATAALATQIGTGALDAAAATRLYRETEGNPLFIVELVRARGGDGSGGGPDRGSAPLPPKAQAVIAGRLALLSEPAREAAAAAAVIGRAFDLDVLVRLVGNEEVVVGALDELWRKRIVREQGPNAYDFSHDKLREVAYGEIGAPHRRQLHKRVAEVLVAANTKDLDPVSARVAAHYENAGLPEEAIPHYGRAATVAQGVYAHEEALALAGRGLSLLAALPASARRDAAELELQLILAPNLRVTKGWAAPDLAAVLERALALCDRVGMAAQRAQILYGMQSHYIVAGRLEKAALVNDEIVRLLNETQGSEPPRSAFGMAAVRLLMGRYQEACDEFEGLARDADPGWLRRLQESQGLNYRVINRAMQSHALWCLGRPDTAVARASEALEQARQLGQPFSQTIAATYQALLQQLLRDAATFGRQAKEALALATETKAVYYRAWAAILVAYAETIDHPEAPALTRLRSAIDDFKATGARSRLPYYLALLADAHLRGGQAEPGLALVEEALAMGRETGERWWDADLHRLRATLLLAGGAEAAEAEAALGRALEIARGQGARSLELRAALELGRLWESAGRSEEARNLVAPILSAFTEGLETPDLRVARAFLSGALRA